MVLPLAFPAYVLAYAYTDFLAHPGAVQSTLRAVTGWGPRDYWFPNVRSLPGAARDADLRLLSLRLPPGAHRLRAAGGLGLPGGADAGQGAVGRLHAGQPADGAAGDRGRAAARGHGDARRLRHRLLLQRPDLLDRHLPGLVRHAGPGGGGAAGALPALLRAASRGARAGAARAGAIAHGGRPDGDAAAAAPGGHQGLGRVAPLLPAGLRRLPAAGRPPGHHGLGLRAEPGRPALPPLRRQLADAGGSGGGGDGDRRGAGRLSHPAASGARVAARSPWARGSDTRCRGA